MDTDSDRLKLLAFRETKRKFLVTVSSASNRELTAMTLDPSVSDVLDLDDDDERVICSELDRRGIPLFDGTEVPSEELMRGCPDCKALAGQPAKRLKPPV
jgi:hypothetical protein